MISKEGLHILYTNKLSMFYTSDLEQHLNIIKYNLTLINPYHTLERRYLSRIIERIENELAERILFAESKQQKKEVSNENIFQVYYRALRSKLHF